MDTHFCVQTAAIQIKLQRPTNTVHPKRIRLSSTSACIRGRRSAVPTEDAVDILSVSILDYSETINERIYRKNKAGYV